MKIAKIFELWHAPSSAGGRGYGYGGRGGRGYGYGGRGYGGRGYGGRGYGHGYGGIDLHL